MTKNKRTDDAESAKAQHQRMNRTQATQPHPFVEEVIESPQALMQQEEQKALELSCLLKERHQELVALQAEINHARTHKHALEHYINTTPTTTESPCPKPRKKHDDNLCALIFEKVSSS